MRKCHFIQSQIHAIQLQTMGELAIVSIMGLGVTSLNQDLLNGLHNFEWLPRLSRYNVSPKKAQVQIKSLFRKNEAIFNLKNYVQS